MRGAVSRSWRRPRAVWDHPRACGEQLSTDSRVSDGGGSSPRVRGAGKHVWCGLRWCRIIPARAGSSCSWWRSWPLRSDHPRACGEQTTSSFERFEPSGSSPRVRGAVAQKRLPRGRWRIIPARAGSRHTSERQRRAGRDHPRACGEQRTDASKSRTASGSSPRVRGAADATAHGPGIVGIIPARAGSRSTRKQTRDRSRDHPRACGEQSSSDAMTLVGWGSSPRVRGAALFVLRSRGCDRIIPARAGSSAPSVLPGRSCPDHPRACGEQPLKAMEKLKVLGSSPRVRGAGRHRIPAALADRIIPARAGSRRSNRCRGASSPDHPRACGEQEFQSPELRLPEGSSPRVRGADEMPPACTVTLRIIPARAGSSVNLWAPSNTS